jgi:hypothetical protein
MAGTSIAAARAAISLVVWGALLFLVGCESGVPGIFHTLATESPRENRNLHDDLTVSSVAAVSGHYYVAAHGLWSRPTGRESWQEVRRPRSGDTQVAVLAMAQSGTTLCVGTERGVHYAEADPKTPSWQRASGITGQVVRLFAIPGQEGEILALTHGGGMYLTDNGCRSFARVRLPEEATASGRPFDVFYDGESYWLTAGNRVFSGNDLHGLTRASQALEESDYRGIWCTGVNLCYFATSDGKIYQWDSNNWELLGTIEGPNDDEELSLTLFWQVGDKILIGTRGYGFYQFGAQDLDLDNVRRGPRSTSQLYRAHITVFIEHGNLLFAGTAGDGLSSITLATARKDTGTWDWE